MFTSAFSWYNQDSKTPYGGSMKLNIQEIVSCRKACTLSKLRLKQLTWCARNQEIIDVKDIVAIGKVHTKTLCSTISCLKYNRLSLLVSMKTCELNESANPAVLWKQLPINWTKKFRWWLGFTDWKWEIGLAESVQTISYQYSYQSPNRKKEAGQGLFREMTGKSCILKRKNISSTITCR